MSFYSICHSRALEVVAQLDSSRKCERLPWRFLVVVAGLLLLPMDLSQLIFAVAGAGAYTILQYFQEEQTWQTRPTVKQMKPAVAAGAPRKIKNNKPKMAQPREPAPRITQPPLILDGISWEADLQLLLEHTVPSAASEATVSQLTKAIGVCLRQAFPSAEVSGYLSCDLCSSRGFRVAVPDLEVVISICPASLRRHLQTRLGQTSSVTRLDPRQLEKAAIRTIADFLVSSYGFKFRRSAFKREEPKLTLLAPASLGATGEAVPIDICVNAVTPIHNAILLAECGNLDRRAKELILLTRRWAKDRGISHDAKGNLSPYHWSLLVIYFLQVADDFEEGSILPPILAFTGCQDLLPNCTSFEQTLKGPPCSVSLSTAQLFKKFMTFYSKFDWGNEMVAPLMGQRCFPILALANVGLCVQDPFCPSNNLASHVTAEGFQRLKEEVLRASQLQAASDVFEAWSPPSLED